MVLAAALLLGALQDTEVIPRAQRELYLAALQQYESAWGTLDSDPKESMAALGRIFAMRGVDRKDRRIQLERPNGTLLKPVDFFPNFLRGRVRLALAKSDPANAALYLAGAVQDFKASSDAGVKASDDYLKSARAQLAALKAPKAPEVPPKASEPTAKGSAAEEALREPWFKLIEAHRFRSARELVDHASSVPAARRQDFARDTDGECAKYVAAQLASFAKAMEVTARPGQLRATRIAEFNRLFELPAPEELVGPFPELDWARREKPVLDAVRQAPPKAKPEQIPELLGRLLAQMEAAEPLEKSGENRFFRLGGLVAYRYVEDVIQSLGTQAKEASAEERGRMHEAAERARSAWSAELLRYPKDFLTRNQVFENAKRLGALLEEFPVDVAQLDSLRVEASLAEGASPDAALEHLIGDLEKIRDEQGPKLPRESQRKLLTELIAATAAREFLSGKGKEEVTKGLQELGRSLALSGGAVEPDRYGPKIARVFAALK